MANKLQKKKTTSVQKIVKKQKTQAEVSAAKTTHAGQATFTLPKGEYVTAVGRRKTATARVRVYREAGDFIVNNKVVGEYFATIPSASTQYNLPLVTADVLGKYAISVKVAGSGTHAQIQAVNHAVSRALIKLDPELRSVLKKRGLLSRDDRMKETRKIGTGGKARRAKQSPKR
jgi:small subunit ribosomal protein S9